MPQGKETIIITGASGFIGKSFLEYTRDRFSIIGIARRSGHEAGIPYHPNISWIQWDIANANLIKEIADYILAQGGADFVVHLAGYYDYDYKDKPEYLNTNVKGTRNVLELSKLLGIRRFIFASSIAACEFPLKGQVINELSPLNARYAYAESKRIGEELLMSYNQYFSGSSVRFAAIFSDWCEFAPLYKFLSTWLSRKWNQRILGGKGKSAITYLHINDLVKLLLTILKKSDALPSYTTYIASPDEPITHYDLFITSTREYSGQSKKAMMVPGFLAYPGILFRNFLHRLGLIQKPFEQPWMIKYIDQQLWIDASYTRKQLNWAPTPRYLLLRRMLFLLVNNKNFPNEWKNKNEAALKITAQRPNLIIYEYLRSRTDFFTVAIVDAIKSSESKKVLSNYRRIKEVQLQTLISTLFHLLLACVRSGDRSLMIKYIDNVAIEIFSMGLNAEDFNGALDTMDKLIADNLKNSKSFQKFRQEIHDYIHLSVQLARDEVEDIYENLEAKILAGKKSSEISLPYYRKQQKIIQKLSRPMQLHSPEKAIKDQERKKQAEFTIYDIK
jgi:nucleoside-diphosphate-sugar epimerase